MPCQLAADCTAADRQRPHGLRPWFSQHMRVCPGVGGGRCQVVQDSLSSGAEASAGSRFISNSDHIKAASEAFTEMLAHEDDERLREQALLDNQDILDTHGSVGSTGSAKARHKCAQHRSALAGMWVKSVGLWTSYQAALGQPQRGHRAPWKCWTQQAAVAPPRPSAGGFQAD